MKLQIMEFRIMPLRIRARLQACRKHRIL